MAEVGFLFSYVDNTHLEDTFRDFIVFLIQIIIAKSDAKILLKRTLHKNWIVFFNIKMALISLLFRIDFFLST